MLALLAPGQGAQKPGMLTAWLDLPGAESFFRRAGELAETDLLELGTTGDAEAIKDTAITQPLVVAMSLFVAGELGALPEKGAAADRDVVITGHSVGELTAAALAGVLTADEAIALTAARGRAMAAACALTRVLQLDAQKVNVNGGAVALGHPIGASGARVLTTLLYAMQQRGARTGMASLCLGGGNAVSLTVEAVP